MLHHSLGLEVNEFFSLPVRFHLHTHTDSCHLHAVTIRGEREVDIVDEGFVEFIFEHGGMGVDIAPQFGGEAVNAVERCLIEVLTLLIELLHASSTNFFLLATA